MLKRPYDQNITHIICECGTNPEDISNMVLNESVIVGPQGNKVSIVTIQSTLQSFDVENWNKRIYGGDLVMESIDNDGMIQNDISRGQWAGEWGHPEDTSPRRQMIILPERSSHRILKYWRAGNLLKANVQSLPYDNGLSMAANAIAGVPASFSLRALGSVDMQTRRAKRPLKVITYDYVYRPSHIEAYQDAVIQETASGLFVPTKFDVNILQECSMVVPLNESITRSQIDDYIKEKSDNLKIIAEMFNVDKFTGILNESATHMIISTDDGMTAHVPVEHVINMQYADLLNLRHPKK